MAWINGVIMGPYHLDNTIQAREEDTATTLQLPHRHHHHHHHHHHESLQGFVSSCNSPTIPKASRGGLNKRTLGRYSIQDDNAINDEELLYHLGDHDLIDELTTNDNPSEKRRRLTMEQVNFLEMSFNSDLKLEPDRKTEIAKQLGIRPRQVAIWFQNRRARWKNKQLEQDYDALKANYEALVKENDTKAKEHGAIVEENMRLLAEVSRLKSLLEKQEINILSDDALMVKKEEETSGKSELTYYSPTKYSSEDQSDDSGQSNEYQPSLDEEEELNPSVKIEEEEGEGDDLHLIQSDDILLFHQIATTHGNGMTCINEDAYLIFNSCEDQLGGFPSWYG